MTNKKFSDLFGEPVRKPETDLLSKFHMDIASSIQAVTEEVILKMTNSLAKEYGMPNLCMAGGVALNCVANAKILKAGHFKNLWVQPAAGDAGGALGAALAVWYKELKNSRVVEANDSMKGSFLGPEFSDSDIQNTLTEIGANFEIMDETSIIELTAQNLIKGKAVGWFQGRMEFGPRALGARSIIADARSETMQKILNLKVKFRESFRPFAPSILREDLNHWFELECDSPYMLLVANVEKNKCKIMTEDEKKLFGIDKLNVKRSIIPAVTHVDYSARVQTVNKETNPKFHSLISKFKNITKCPLIVNTSFNIRGEPIVCSPRDAFKCFMGTDLDYLIIGNCVLKKTTQDKLLKLNYSNTYELD